MGKHTGGKPGGGYRVLAGLPQKGGRRHARPGMSHSTSKVLPVWLGENKNTTGSKMSLAAALSPWPPFAEACGVTQ